MAEQQKRYVETYVNSMQCHVRMHITATYFNIEYVEKIDFTTWRQALSCVGLSK